MLERNMYDTRTPEYDSVGVAEVVHSAMSAFGPLRLRALSRGTPNTSSSIALHTCFVRVVATHAAHAPCRRDWATEVRIRLRPNIWKRWFTVWRNSSGTSCEGANAGESICVGRRVSASFKPWIEPRNRAGETTSQVLEHHRWAFAKRESRSRSCSHKRRNMRCAFAQKDRRSLGRNTCDMLQSFSPRLSAQTESR